MPTTVKTGTVPTIHVVDDDESFRAAMERLLKSTGYRVKSYSSGSQFMNAGVPRGPGCILIDMSMPDLSGLDVQERLTKGEETLPIIFVSGHGDIPTTVRAMQAGAVDFLTKPIQKEALLRAVALALARNAEARSLHEKSSEAQTLYQALTPRQRSVFQGVVAGKLNKQMAIDLGIAERTVKVHRSKVMRKMHVDSVAALVRRAIELQGESEAGS